MRKFLLLSALLCLIWTLPAWCQDKSKAFIGLLNQGSIQRQTYHWSLSPMAGMQWQRHQLAAGPIIILKDFSGGLEDLPRLTGIQANYRYFLKPSAEKPLRMFAEFISKAQFINESWTSNYWNPDTQVYQDVEQGSREQLWQNFAGLGVQYRLKPKILMQLSAGAGYSISRLKKTGSSPDINDQNFDYRTYAPKSMVYALNYTLYILL